MAVWSLTSRESTLFYQFYRWNTGISLVENFWVAWWYILLLGHHQKINFCRALNFIIFIISISTSILWLSFIQIEYSNLVSKLIGHGLLNWVANDGTLDNLRSSWKGGSSLLLFESMHFVVFRIFLATTF